jgi:uncharacterized membrane protein
VDGARGGAVDVDVAAPGDHAAAPRGAAACDAVTGGPRRRIPASIPHIGKWDIPRLRRAGLGVLGLQFLALAAWGSTLAQRFATTRDFSIYYQAFWQISHGTLDPFDTLEKIPFWQSHGELLLWPASLLGLVWPRPETLLWLQAAGLVAAEAVAYVWICEIATRVGGGDHGSSALAAAWPPLLAGTGLVALVADPWTYWAASWDFHFEVVGILFVLLAAREVLGRRRRRVWWWVALAVLSGDVVTSYLVAVAACAAVATRACRRLGLVVAGIGIAALLVASAVHANKGSGLATGYGYLALGAGATAPAQMDLFQLVTGIAAHPLRAADVLWSRRVDLYAGVAPGGLLGAVSPWTWLVVAAVLAENALNHYLGFISPGFQDVLLLVVVPVGTVELLGRLSRRHRTAAIFLAALVAANAIGWGAVWLPRTPSQWLQVSPAGAATLSSVERRIRPADEVVVSQGVAGAFSGRRWIYAVQRPGTLPVRARVVWVVVAPAQGIETESVVDAEALVSEMAWELHAPLVANRAGIWAFRWLPPAGSRRLVIPGHPTTVGAWATPGAAGAADTAGPAADWRAVSAGSRGYVVADDYWPERPGRYRVTVTLATSVPVFVEVWNATGDALLARDEVPASNGTRAVSLVVDARRVYPPAVYRGFGPFAIDPVPPTSRNQLEVRVWSPGGGSVSVASIEVAP